MLEKLWLHYNLMNDKITKIQEQIAREKITNTQNIYINLE